MIMMMMMMIMIVIMMIILGLEPNYRSFEPQLKVHIYIFE